jgi:hypothetical protein
LDILSMSRRVFFPSQTFRIVSNFNWSVRQVHKAHYLVAQHTTYPLDQIELQLLNFHRCTSSWKPRTMEVSFSGSYSHACLDNSPGPYRNENFSLAQRALLHPAMNGCSAWSRRRLQKEAQFWQGAEVCPFVCDCEWSASHPGLE